MTPGGPSTATFLLSHADVLRVGVWQMIQKEEDPDLKRLAKSLPITVLHSRATSSTKKYLGAFKRWKCWAADHKLPVFPAREHHVALYLQHLAESRESKSAAEEAVNALGWVHSLAGVPSPSVSQFVQKTLGGIQRMLARPVQKKEPVTAEMLADLVADATKHSSLSNIRLAAACLLSFAGFLRFDELVRLRPIDIGISPSMAKLRICQSKADQLRKGDEVLIARTRTATCPVAMLEKYMAMAGIPPSSELFLFRAITKTKKGEVLRSTGSLSYSRLSELFRLKLKQLGYAAGNYGLHSLRAGGATAAARAGVPDRLFKRHGRWKSEAAKDGYVDDSVEARLAVSKNLGL